MAVSRKLHVRAGDTVEIISGKDKSKRGKIIAAFPRENKILVQGINMISRHQKPRGMNQQGGIIKQEGAIHSSKAMLVCNKCDKKTRIAHTILGDGTKVRVCKVCGETFDN